MKALKLTGALSCFFSALESQLVSQFCEDENGALIYNRITNGHWNSNNGHGNGLNGNNGHAREISGQHDIGVNIGTDVSYRTDENNNYEEEIQISRRPIIRGRGDTFTLPISADPLPFQVTSKI